MRRALTLSLTLLVLFTAAVWAGFYLAGRIAPERLRSETERRLSNLLDTPVQIERTRLSLRWGLILEANGVELSPAGAGSQLRIERFSAHLDPVALLMARFRFDRLALEGARLSIQGASPASAPEGGRDLRAAIEALDEAARSWLEGSLPVRTVELRSGTILISDPAL